MLTLHASHLITFKRSLRDPRSVDVIGLYEGQDDNYLLVVRVPENYRTEKIAAGLAGGAAGLLATGLLARKLYPVDGPVGGAKPPYS